MWLDLIRLRCLRRGIRLAETTMSEAERVKLLDAAMRPHDAEGYLDSVKAAFEGADRSGDAIVAAALGALLGTGEIERAMFLRAEWQGRRATAQPRLGRAA